MKLGKLLAAGKSVMSGRGDVSYRARKQVFLPNFGMAKNPFKTQTTQNVEHEEPKVAEPPTATLAPHAEAPISRPAHSAGECKKTATWADKLNPASIFRVISPKTGPVAAAAGQRQPAQATQTELKLDSVKVLHNDLSDVDVEVVPIKSRSGAADLPPPKKSWEFLGERLFGVEAT
jgi:hypothetical protein